MPRVRMIAEREEASPAQLDTFDHIVASRGSMIRPFAAMLHRPEIARATADLGAVIRYQGTLSEYDRELVICTTAVERGCEFEWQCHAPLARAAGVSDATLEAVRSRSEATKPSDATLVEFARELCRTDGVGETTFERARARLGEAGTVELAAIVGYYTMMALFMSACDAC